MGKTGKTSAFRTPVQVITDFKYEDAYSLATIDLKTAKYPVYVYLNDPNFQLKSFEGLKAVNPKTLKELDLSGNQLENVSDLIPFQMLKRLNLSHNLLKEAILPLKNLQMLQMSHNELEQFPDLSQLPMLTYLNLSNNSLNGNIGVLACCPRLVTLDLSTNKFDWDLEAFLQNVQVFGRFQWLSELNFSNNPPVNNLYGYRHWMCYFAFRVMKFDGNFVAPEQRPHNTESWRRVAESLIKEKYGLPGGSSAEPGGERKTTETASNDEVEDLREETQRLRKKLERMQKERLRADEDAGEQEEELHNLKHQIAKVGGRSSISEYDWDPTEGKRSRVKERRKSRSQSMMRRHMDEGLSSNLMSMMRTDGGGNEDALEREVLEEHNLCRADPQRYARYVEDFRQYYEGNVCAVPGLTPVVTEEGLDAVDECIDFLQSQDSVPLLSFSRALSLAARDLVDDQGPSGATGHEGVDGSSPTSRCQRYGDFTEGWTGPGESCVYGPNTARYILIHLLIDDGNPSRGHRENVFNEDYTLLGVGCGSHAEYDYMATCVYAAGFLEKKSIRSRPHLSVNELRDAINQVEGDDTTLVEFDGGFGIQAVDFHEHPIRVEDYISITLRAPVGVYMTAALNDSKTRTFVQRKGDKMIVEAVTPGRGSYTLDLFAKEGIETKTYENVGHYKLIAKGGTPEAGFPQIFRAFNDREAFLFGPKDKYLEAGYEYKFKLRVSTALKIAVVNNNRWHHLAKGKGGVFSGMVTVEPGDLSICGEFDEGGKFSGLLQYEVISN